MFDCLTFTIGTPCSHNELYNVAPFDNVAVLSRPSSFQLLESIEHGTTKQHSNLGVAVLNRRLTENSNIFHEGTIHEPMQATWGLIDRKNGEQVQSNPKYGRTTWFIQFQSRTGQQNNIS
jgi:hypothetical protein